MTTAPSTPTDPPAASSPPARPPGAWLLWSAAGLAVAAAAVSGYLLWVSISASRGPAGCGGDGGCEQLLAGRWSAVFGVPVSGPAVGVYLGIAATAGLTAFAVRLRRLAAIGLIALSAAAAGAAVWFVYLQFVRLRDFCPYCLTVHACGLAIGGLVAAWVVRNGRRAGVVSPARTLASVTVGLLAAGGLAVAQVVREPAPPPPRTYVTQLPGGPVEIDINQFPVLGRRDAPHPVVVMVDYTCHYCRALHATLHKALPRYGGQVAFVIVPVPLNTDCNRYMRRTDDAHKYACDYARLALAVWRGKPEAYGAFDAYVFADPMPAVPDARRRAAELLGGEAELKKAEADPWVAKRLADDADLYNRAGQGAMPKMVFRDHAVVPPSQEGQTPRNVEALFKQLEFELHVKPVGP